MRSVQVWPLVWPIKWNWPSVTIWSVFQNPVTNNDTVKMLHYVVKDIISNDRTKIKTKMSI